MGEADEDGDRAEAVALCTEATDAGVPGLVRVRAMVSAEHDDGDAVMTSMGLGLGAGVSV
jgi:hypothetical protein